MQHATSLLHDFEKARAIAGVAAELVVDQCACVPQRAQGACGHALQRGMLLHQQEGFEDGGRFAVKDLVIADVEKIVGNLEAFVDWLWCLVRQW
jgi:hypothetical protein